MQVVAANALVRALETNNSSVPQRGGRSDAADQADREALARRSAPEEAVADSGQWRDRRQSAPTRLRVVNAQSSATAGAARQRAQWQTQIPPNAIFYDEVADITKGIDQPGLLISVRV